MKRIILVVLFLICLVTVGYSQTSPCYTWNSTTGAYIYHASCSGTTTTESSVVVLSNKATCDFSAGATCIVTMQNSSTAWTLTLSNAVSGYSYRIWFIQNATGGGSAAPLPTFSPTITWGGTTSGITPTLTITATKRDVVGCYYSTSVWSGFLCDIDQGF